jgi:hypothetical protein
MYAINTQIKAQDIQPGMVVDIYSGSGSERVAVSRVLLDGYGAVQIADHIDWYGLGLTELVTVAGYFNV